MSRELPETRERILRATAKTLEAGGGREVRMRDIAQAAGISRQALYLHFPNRADLLIATTRHLDDVNKVDERLASSRAAASGVERLDAFVEAWANYIPEIAGVALALSAMMEGDEAARIAWSDRMQAVREGCLRAVEALERDGHRRSDLTVAEATDLLWVQLSIRNWKQLTQECGWSQARYAEAQKAIARRTHTTTCEPNKGHA